MSEKTSFVSPIKSFFILDVGGVPIFAVRYEEDTNSIQMSESEVVLFAGFLAAVEMFSRTNLNCSLRDIGFGSERYFFFKEDSESNYFLVSSAVLPEDVKEAEEVKNIVEHILQQSFFAFQLLIEMADEESMDVKGLTGNFGATLDSIILETSMFFGDGEETVDDYESSSETLRDSTIELETNQVSVVDRTMSRVRNFFRRK